MKIGELKNSQNPDSLPGAAPGRCHYVDGGSWLDEEDTNGLGWLWVDEGADDGEANWADQEIDWGCGWAYEDVKRGCENTADEGTDTGIGWLWVEGYEGGTDDWCVIYG